MLEAAVKKESSEHDEAVFYIGGLGTCINLYGIVFATIAFALHYILSQQKQ